MAPWVFDLGAHLGEDTEYYLRKGYRVVAVEANPDCLSFIQRRFSTEIAQKKLVLVDRALWRSADKEIFFFKNKKVTAWGTVLSSWAERNRRLGCESSRIRVKTTTIGSLLKKFGVPHYIKIDLEGFDLEILRQLNSFAAKNSSFRKCRFISWESSKTSLGDLVEEFQLAQSMGFSRFAVVPQHSIGNDSSGPFGKDLKGEFLNPKDALDAYADIFTRYRLMGDRGVLNRFFHGELKPGKRDGKLLFTLLKAVGYPAGWYDTHAARA